MAYPKLDQASLCNTCMGCSQLENFGFRGKVICNNYKDGLTVKERAERLQKDMEQIKYGSMYGNNN